MVDAGRAAYHAGHRRPCGDRALGPAPCPESPPLKRPVLSLRLKIHLIVGGLATVFVLVVIGLRLHGMRETVREEVVAANRVASQLLNRTVWMVAARGPGAMVEYLQGMGRVRANDIVLSTIGGEVLYQSPPSPYKAGRNAPDWFSRLIVPPLPVQVLEFPSGGRLTITPDASRSAIDAWDQLLAIAATALALLLALHAIVYALVGQTVRPFGKIVAALNRLEAGQLDVQIERLPGQEAAAIGAAFNRMVEGLRARIEAERRASVAERELSDRRELARWIDHHLEEERKLIARELHDELGQSVTAIRSLALAVAGRTAGKDASSEQAARVIADESQRLYAAMHGLIPRLAPLVLDAFGLADTLRDLVERTERSQPGVQVGLQVQLDQVQLDAETALALYRAAQEGLTNALRHGQATAIELSLSADPAGARLRVDDNGSGLPADWQARAGHYGLRWMGERIEGLGGGFAIRNREPGPGVRLDIWVPTGQTQAPAGRAEPGLPAPSPAVPAPAAAQPPVLNASKEGRA